MSCIYNGVDVSSTCSCGQANKRIMADHESGWLYRSGCGAIWQQGNAIARWVIPAGLLEIGEVFIVRVQSDGGYELRQHHATEIRYNDADKTITIELLAPARGTCWLRKFC